MVPFWTGPPTTRWQSVRRQSCCSALKGSVGTVADPLEIDVSTGSLTVSAAHDIVIVDVAGGLQIADVVSYAGDIHLSTPDAAGPGQDL